MFDLLFSHMPIPSLAVQCGFFSPAGELTEKLLLPTYLCHIFCRCLPLWPQWALEGRIQSCQQLQEATSHSIVLKDQPHCVHPWTWQHGHQLMRWDPFSLCCIPLFLLPLCNDLTWSLWSLFGGRLRQWSDKVIACKTLLCNNYYVFGWKCHCNWKALSTVQE